MIPFSIVFKPLANHLYVFFEESYLVNFFKMSMKSSGNINITNQKEILANYRLGRCHNVMFIMIHDKALN